MSIKLVDTLESMGNFPVANADGIQFTDGESLQKKLDDGSLGGGAEAYTELSQEEYDTLTDEEKANGTEYRTYDTGRIYKYGVVYGEKKPIELTYAEYKALEEAGGVEADVDYTIISNESGVLLSDLDTNHGDSEISTYEVIETLKSDVENLTTELKISENTDKTPIVYDAYMSSTTNESNFYIVRNGICYVYMDFTMTIDNPSGKGILLEKIPKPIGVISCQAVLYNNSNMPQGILILNTDGTIIAEHNLTLNERYLCNFSYPIA